MNVLEADSDGDTDDVGTNVGDTAADSEFDDVTVGDAEPVGDSGDSCD